MMFVGTLLGELQAMQRRSDAQKQNMSFRAQVAFGKNLTLQRQLDRKFQDFKRSFKNSRRRQDTLEEECVSSLYKLLLECKTKQNERDIQSATTSRSSCKSSEARRLQSVFELSDERVPKDPRRSQTVMSVHSYVQSYSFKKNGMNIGQNRRDRFIKTRKEKRNEDHEVQIERRKRPGSSTEPDIEFEKKMELLEHPGDHPDGGPPPRPKTAEPKLGDNRSLKSSLKRPGTRNTMTPSQTSTYSAAMMSNTKELENVKTTGQPAMSFTATPRYGDNTLPTEKQTALVGPSSYNEHDKPHIQMRIKAFLSDQSVKPPETTRFKTQYIRDDEYEAELLPLTDEEKLQLSWYDDKDKSRSGLTKSQLNHPSDQILEKSSTKTQSFLTDYAKKSKLFGYVVKTRSSAVAPRDTSRKTYRSPAITYQELVSIKANIKQHETRTRLLIQKSAKLSKYVDDLVVSADMRQLYADAAHQQMHVHG